RAGAARCLRSGGPHVRLRDAGEPVPVHRLRRDGATVRPRRRPHVDRLEQHVRAARCPDGAGRADDRGHLRYLHRAPEGDPIALRESGLDSGIPCAPPPRSHVLGARTDFRDARGFPDYSPWLAHVGSRFPALNAAAPMVCLSLRMNIEMIISASMRRRSSSVRPTPRNTDSLSARMAPWGSAAISRATAWARSRALPRGTISL